MDPYVPPFISPSVTDSTSKPVASTVVLVLIMVVWTGLLIGVVLPRVEPVYRELGRQLPQVTLWILNPVIHVSVAAVWLGLCAYRFQQPRRWWVSHALFLLLLAHLVGTITGFMMPAMGLREQLG